jgi:hypothetical protein
MEGTSVTLDDPTREKSSFTAPSVAGGGETLVFELVVTDDFAFNPKIIDGGHCKHQRA